MVAKKQVTKSATKTAKKTVKKPASVVKKATVRKKKPSAAQKARRTSVKSVASKLTSLHKKIIGTAVVLVLLATAAIGILREPLGYASTESNINLTSVGGNCLDNDSARAVNGNRIQMYHCNGTIAQKVSLLDDQTIRIQGMCLDLRGGKKVAETYIQLYTCKGYATQKWKMQNDGSILNVSSNLCLDVQYSQTADKTPVWIYACNHTGAQKWVKLSPATTPTNAPTPTTPQSTSTGTTQTPQPKTTKTIGTYQPDESTTGYSANTLLTAYNAETTDSFTLSKGGVIENKIIYGDLKYTGSDDLLIKNCLLVGGRQRPANATAIVDVNSTRGGTVTVQDSTIRARAPRDNRDGITGYKYRAYRNDISNTVDGFGAFVVPSRAGTKNADVVIAGNYVHNLAYTYNNQTAHADGTHNDGLQIQGGRNIQVKGNFFELTTFTMVDGGTNPDKPWLMGTNNANGSGVIIQDNTGAGIDNSAVIEQNYFSRGLAQVNIKPGISFVLRDNKFYRSTAVSPVGGWSGYWVRLDRRSGTVVDGLNAGTPSNRWIDGPYAGQLLSEPRDRGIHYNA